MSIILKVSGGIYPGKYRSSSVEITGCDDLNQGYDSVENWAKKEFPDWNNISTESRIISPLVTIKPYTKTHIFISRRK